MATVYLETTIPSYLTSRESNDILLSAKQHVTREWWDTRRNDFELYISEVVLIESQAGDPKAAERRIEILTGIPLLEPKDPSNDVTQALIEKLSLPDRAAVDAAHIAICVVNGIDFLLTWNFTHIANAAFRPMIEEGV